MDVSAYFKSISLELSALKNRVRNFIDTNHWQTDGEWKESVLRAIIKRHLPKNIEVGRGFVITPDSCSQQIDVLIYDSSIPILYKDGDLVFITSDAVRGVIEVKTKVYKNSFKNVLTKLANNIEFIKYSLNNQDRRRIFVGLFAYESDFGDEYSSKVLNCLHNAAQNNESRIVNHISIGESVFIRYWEISPHSRRNYNSWRFYSLPNIAPGYFINNLVSLVAEDSVELNKQIWFPPEGKELNAINEKRLYDALPLNQSSENTFDIENTIDEIQSNN